MSKRAELDEVERRIREGESPAHPQLLSARRAAYVEHAQAMKSSAAINEWAERMREAHGSEVTVWKNELPWIEALLVVRYGEAIEHWPDEFTEDDVIRAGRWERGEYTPFGVKMEGK